MNPESKKWEEGGRRNHLDELQKSRGMELHTSSTQIFSKVLPKGTKNPFKAHPCPNTRENPGNSSSPPGVFMRSLRHYKQLYLCELYQERREGAAQNQGNLAGKKPPNMSGWRNALQSLIPPWRALDPSHSRDRNKKCSQLPFGFVLMAQIVPHPPVPADPGKNLLGIKLIPQLKLAGNDSIIFLIPRHQGFDQSQFSFPEEGFYGGFSSSFKFVEKKRMSK